MKKWQKWGAGALAAGALYAIGNRDGATPTPEGQQEESVQDVQRGAAWLLGLADAGGDLGQGVVVEGGEVLQMSGNAATGAGGAISQNTVPGAPPK